jgi:hypothetical protein
MGIIPAQIKYNLHQMNKEIIHQAAQAHAENLYTTIERSRRSNVYTGHTVPYGYRKHCKLVEKHFKAGVIWYQEQH